MPKPRVLPVPVFACPMMSAPESATGRVIAWMGKGWVMPAAASDATIGPETPNSAKSASVSAMSQTPFGAFALVMVANRYS